jgi:hypothetical protein
VISKEKTEKRNKSRRNLKRRKEKASPHEKQTSLPRKGASTRSNILTHEVWPIAPTGQIRVGGERVKKKPRVEKQGLGKGFYSFFLSLSLSPHTERKGL